MYRVTLFFICALASVTCRHYYRCEHPPWYDFSEDDSSEYGDYRPPATRYPPPRPTKLTTSTPQNVATPRPTPPPNNLPPPPAPQQNNLPHRPTPPPNHLPPPPTPQQNNLPPRRTPPPNHLPPPPTPQQNNLWPRPNPPPNKLPPPPTPQQNFITSRPTPPRINSVQTETPVFQNVGSRLGDDIDSVQQTQQMELRCLDTLDRLLSAQWQEDIDKLSVSDLGTFSTTIAIPLFSDYYSNPESEWIQQDGSALKKLDKCVRNLVSKVAPRMDPGEIACLNRIYPDYLTREITTAKGMAKLMQESAAEPNLPFRSFYTYFDITEVLFENKNLDSLDAEIRATHEDMLEFYIKTEEDKTQKIFVIEQECEWKNVRFLREATTDNARYQRFGELIKLLTDRYLVSEILHQWKPGTIISPSRYALWNKARTSMEDSIKAQQALVQKERRDAQYLCTYAAELATKLYTEQKSILFENKSDATVPTDLQAHEKYSYVVALQDLLAGKPDSRLSRVQVLVKEFKEGFYCLTNFIRMIENHQRYALASLLTNQALPYGFTFCLIKENSAGLINPRFCKCQGTFCEEFGLATIRSNRYQLNLLPDNTYTVSTNSSYRILALDELVEAANQRIAGQKFNTWWYRNQNKTKTMST